MQVKVVPTRMELLRLRRRIALARRGHKLLQDRLEGLMKEFLPLVEEYARYRRELDQGTAPVLSLFAEAAAEAGEGALRSALAQTGFSAQVEVREAKRAEVPVRAFSALFRQGPPHYSLLGTPLPFDEGVERLRELFRLLLETAEREDAVRALAAEIERTRRRVNALQHVLLPRLARSLKLIQSKLDEDERSARVRNLKVKELLEKEAARQGKRD